jgi:hypothetical protein
VLKINRRRDLKLAPPFSFGLCVKRTQTRAERIARWQRTGSLKDQLATQNRDHAFIIQNTGCASAPPRLMREPT